MVINKITKENGYNINDLERLSFLATTITPTILPINNPNIPHITTGLNELIENKLSRKKKELNPQMTKATDAQTANLYRR